MNIVNIPEEGKNFIDYEVRKNTISFNDDELVMNLSKRERDDAVHIDICTDPYDALVMGTAAGLRYVAQIDIPARGYTEETVEAESEDEEPKTIRKPVPFDMSKVTLTLWEMEE